MAHRRKHRCGSGHWCACTRRNPSGHACGHRHRNPVGLAAGFDKDGTAAQALAALGFGFIEVGSVTSEPQPGNPRPRLFRLPRDRALINRAGFNNCGAAQLAENIKRHRPDCVLGVNIGKSRRAPVQGAAAEYLQSFEAIYDVADYIAILWKGRIVESGPAAELFNSDNQFVRQFLSGEARGPLGME